MAPKSPEEEQEALQSAIKASAEEAAPVEAASKTANSSSPANVATPPGETPGKMAKEKNAKENAEEKRKKKGCQQRHRVELNPLKTETDLRSLWNSENHTKEQACEVLAKLVDSRHITGKHFEHSALVQDIMVFLKERAEREGVCKVLKRCADALCFWSAAGALQQQRKPGQDTLRTGAQIRSPPAARPVRKLGGAGKALLLAGLAVAGCAWLVFSVKTGLVTWNASSIDKSAPVVDCAWLLPAVKTGLVDLNAASMAIPAPSRMQDCGWLLVLLVLRAFGGWGVRYVAHQQQKLRPKRERACGAAGDTICLNPGKGTGGEAADSRSCSGGGVAPHRMLRVSAQEKQHKLKLLRVVQKSQWHRQSPGPSTAASPKLRRQRPAALELFALCIISVLRSTHGAECARWGKFPCTFGGCTFSKNSGVLIRTGSCPTQSGRLWMDTMGITALSDGVFHDMGACTDIILHHNYISSLYENTFSGLTSLTTLGLGDNPLTCVPLTQAQIASFIYYSGPTVTCPCSSCVAGKYLGSGTSYSCACTSCDAGKYSAAAGVHLLAIHTHSPARTYSHTNTRPQTHYAHACMCG